MVLAAIIALVAVVGAVLVALLTSDKELALAQGGPGQVTSDGSGAGGSGTSVGATSAPSAAPSAPVPAQSPQAGTGATGSGTLSSPPTGTQLRSNFPLPPNSSSITSYGTLTPPSSEQWYLTTTGLAAVKAFYTTTLTRLGAFTYIAPSVYHDAAGNATGYYYIYHFHNNVTVDLGMDSDYLDVQPGTVLIRVGVSDD